MVTLALFLAATLIMVIGGVLSFPVFDAHESKQNTDKEGDA